MALEITDSNFQEILAEGKPVVMDFWAPWCGPCKMVGPIIDELATENVTWMRTVMWLPNMAYATSLQSCSSRMESWWTSR